jgi:glyoxylase-like metal-dependent hydrolase (beta-lactamase superfamily II)
MTDASAHVEPDGPWLELRDGPLIVRKRSVSEMDNNVYAIACAETRWALVVDAADDAPRIRAMLDGLTPLAVVQTHGHWDHVRAWVDLAADPGLEVWGHAGDVTRYPLAPDRLLEDAQIIAVGTLAVEVLHVSGHTDGSLCLLVAGAQHRWLFTGDTLFPGGHGRTATTEDHVRIMDGLEARVFGRLDDTTRVLPGHGDGTTLGAERPHLDAWRARGW